MSLFNSLCNTMARYLLCNSCRHCNINCCINSCFTSIKSNETENTANSTVSRESVRNHNNKTENTAIDDSIVKPELELQYSPYLGKNKLFEGFAGNIFAPEMPITLATSPNMANTFTPNIKKIASNMPDTLIKALEYIDNELKSLNRVNSSHYADIQVYRFDLIVKYNDETYNINYFLYSDGQYACNIPDTLVTDMQISNDDMCKYQINNLRTIFET